MHRFFHILTIFLFIYACSKDNASDQPGTDTFKTDQVLLGDTPLLNNAKNVSVDADFKLVFATAIAEQNLDTHIEILNEDKTKVPLSITLSENKKTISVHPANHLNPLNTYTFIIRKSLSTTDNKKLDKEYSYLFTTTIDNSDKFDRISTEELLTKVQQQTFKYFWDLAHPAYGMIRERNTSGETVTTGGTGFGIMVILIGIERGFVTHQQGLDRVKQIVSFLKQADTYHGAFSHWYNGSTAKTQPFSEKDDGADLVETSLLFQGLITAREYFADTQLSTDITSLYNNIEWNFFRNNQNALFWHWSPNHTWEMNLKISGWNESLITYVLAAGSKNHTIDIEDYNIGWAKSGAIKNGKLYYNIPLPLGPENGGPLFLSQYSFLGLNPFGLQDEYASYEEQVKNHTLINRAYCIANPKGFAGYSEHCWGLTASDDIEGYMAHSPDNDNGVISPTAALSSMPYTPDESLKALEFFYYKLGDKIWGDYGFKDAFSLTEPWFAESYLAIDQGPIIIGIENYRSKLLWKHFMQAPEIKSALQKLNFTSPNI
ncbi:Ig-like domain-containing protein [Sphingobacterium chuzhouense]|uniref:Ig-like domain-containing protein n=2 Tax=Sphingobacterium chuzhouense TaxID=1742264 RepID=A0ABR7XQL3_9SPHI|nr:Ig-like domain-containing protein [Sphingobacterium chuzhouense]